MLQSENWIAQAIPSIDGSKVTLQVSGDVTSGIIPPTLIIYTPQRSLPSNIFTLELLGDISGAITNQVGFSFNIIGRDELNVVLVFKDNDVIAAIPIDRSILS